MQNEPPILIIVKETHGIRRFLYPFRLPVSFSESQIPELDRLRLVTQSGETLPMHFSGKYLLDFALSLAPYETKTLELKFSDLPPAALPDPLQLAHETETLFVNTQQRVRYELTNSGVIGQVVYDGINHLVSPSQITRNGKLAKSHSSEPVELNSRINANFQSSGTYDDGIACTTNLEITACKSWITLTHTLGTMNAGDLIEFALPFAAASPLLTCDFGALGGIYGKLEAGVNEEIAWEFKNGTDNVEWSLCSGSRVDFAGSDHSFEDVRSALWFHLIDKNKAIAVAITEIPDGVTSLKITLMRSGKITIAFHSGMEQHEPSTFGVCYHFLNDIPPIAAATNPQSILLRPICEIIQ